MNGFLTISVTFVTLPVYCIMKQINMNSMKTKSIYLAAFFVMGVIVTTLGSDEPRKAGLVVVPVKGSETFRVIYTAENTNKVKLNLYNLKSELMFSEVINESNGFILPLNFSGVAYGEYTLEVIDASGKKIERISYQPSVAALNNIRIAKISGNEDKFLVSVATPGSEKITVRIFDTNNNLVHNQIMNVEGNFAQVYFIKNLAGACKFEVSDNTGNTKTAQF
jgi:hypothetical protein